VRRVRFGYLDVLVSFCSLASDGSYCDLHGRCKPTQRAEYAQLVQVADVAYDTRMSTSIYYAPYDPYAAKRKTLAIDTLASRAPKQTPADEIERALAKHGAQLEEQAYQRSLEARLREAELARQDAHGVGGLARQADAESALAQMVDEKYARTRSAELTAEEAREAKAQDALARQFIGEAFADLEREYAEASKPRTWRDIEVVPFNGFDRVGELRREEESRRQAALEAQRAAAREDRYAVRPLSGVERTMEFMAVERARENAEEQAQREAQRAAAREAEQERKRFYWGKD